MKNTLLERYFTPLRGMYEKLNAYNKAMYSRATSEEWIALLKQRGAFIAQMSQSFDELFAALRTTFLEREATDEEYDALYDCLRFLNNSKLHEPFLGDMLVDILLPHYEKKDDPLRLNFLLYFGAMCEMQISRNGDLNAAHKSVERSHRAMNLIEDPRVTDNLKSLGQLLCAYINYCMTLPSNDLVVQPDICDRWRRVMRLLEERRANCEVPYLPEHAAIIERIECGFPEMIYSVFVNNLVTTPGQLEQASEIMRGYCETDGRLDLERCDPDHLSTLFYSYHRMLFMEGRETADEAWRAMNSFLLEQNSRIDEIMELTGNSPEVLINPILQIIPVLSKTTLPAAEKAAHTERYCKMLFDCMQQFPAGLYSYTINMGMLGVAFSPEIHSMLRSARSRKQLIYNCVILRHVTTHLHSVMVSRLAEAIADAVFERDPLHFDGLLGYNGVAELISHMDEIKEYIHSAAMLHDVGKNAMIEVVCMEYRRLTDAEFAILRQHPAEGAELLSVSRSFDRYRDVVLGHHRTYDGKGGYPMDFDNTASPYKPVIDLVMLSDCIDAATDYLGRGYKKAKDFETLFGELRAGAGTSYDPRLVEIMLEDGELYQKLRWLTGDGRRQIYYEVYQGFNI